ncbi:MAG: hypothetical protein JOZ39_09435 [Chloroflexi bacterium]|nr:hypothetical protein [Chloroflexota bacterium]
MKTTRHGLCVISGMEQEITFRCQAAGCQNLAVAFLRDAPLCVTHYYELVQPVRHEHVKDSLEVREQRRSAA